MVGGSELKSVVGTTKGDPLAVSMYAISLQPLVSLLHNRCTAKQCWFADDATGAGPLEEVKQWWDELREAGPPLVYYPNSKKCWLVVKPERKAPRRKCLQGLVSASPPRGANTLVLRWAHGLILSNMWVTR